MGKVHQIIWKCYSVQWHIHLLDWFDILLKLLCQKWSRNSIWIIIRNSDKCWNFRRLSMRQMHGTGGKNFILTSGVKGGSSIRNQLLECGAEIKWRNKFFAIFQNKFFVWNIMKVFSYFNDWEAPCDDIKGRRYRGCVTHLILHSHFSSVPRERVCEIFAYCCQFSWRLSRARISLNNELNLDLHLN